MARRFAGSLGLMVVFGVASAPVAKAADCTRADFETVVGDAAAELRKLNHVNKPQFQSKLRQLKEKRGWSHDQFLTNAAPIVQDATIAGYDSQSSGFLGRIEQLGAQGASTDKPDCKLLGDVRQNMRDLVQVQTAKWQYMFNKIDSELGK